MTKSEARWTKTSEHIKQQEKALDDTLITINHIKEELKYISNDLTKQNIGRAMERIENAIKYIDDKNILDDDET
jgi:hypothetical protein